MVNDLYVVEHLRLSDNVRIELVGGLFIGVGLIVIDGIQMKHVLGELLMLLMVDHLGRLNLRKDG